MPRSTAREESNYPLPAETLLPATLVSVDEKVITFTYKAHHKTVQNGERKVGDEGRIEKWSWKFQVSDGEYAGLHAWGESENFLGTSDRNRVKQWGEAVRGGVPFEVGETIDTDDLLGLPCQIEVMHEEPRMKADGSGYFYGCPVINVYPASASDDLPPF